MSGFILTVLVSGMCGYFIHKYQPQVKEFWLEEVWYKAFPNRKPPQNGSQGQ